MRYLYVTVALGFFWVVLSGHFAPLLLGFGALSVSLVLIVVRRMDRADRQPGELVPQLGLVGYIAWLLKLVIESNIDLARRIWNPALPIEPVWTRLDTHVVSPQAKTLYANSITLTPGTLTTQVHEDHFMIHALSAEGIEKLRLGEMERRIARLDL